MTEELDILLHSESQLLDWGESRSTGPWIKLRLPDPDLLDVFRGMDTATMKKTGHILHITIAQGDIATLAEEEPPSRGRYGEFWRDLIASGFFRALPVLREIGSEDRFEEWIRQQPSVINGNCDWDPDKGERRCEPAHIRSVADGSGTAEKPPYFAVPMTHKQHQLQHDKGYSAVTGLIPGEAIEFLSKRADRYRTEWASLRLAEILAPNTSSRAEVHPDMVRSWVSENDLGNYFPKKLREDEV